jgi:hypothetical protein
MARLLRLGPAAVLALTTLVVGCGRVHDEVPVALAGHLPAPLVAPLPVRMGVYFSPEFSSFAAVDRHYAYRGGQASAATAYHLPLGPPSRVLLEDAFAALFERTVLVPERPPGLRGVPPVDAVIEPRISSAWRGIVVFEFTLLEPDGSQIASWHIEGASPPARVFDRRERAQLETQQAMRQAVAKLLLTFERQYGVARWLTDLEARNPSARAQHDTHDRRQGG